MGLHEPDSNFEPEYEYPAWVCFDCNHEWVPEDWTLEPDEEYGVLLMPDERNCPACGSEETDEK